MFLAPTVLFLCDFFNPILINMPMNEMFHFRPMFHFKPTPLYAECGLPHLPHFYRIYKYCRIYDKKFITMCYTKYCDSGHKSTHKVPSTVLLLRQLIPRTGLKLPKMTWIAHAKWRCQNSTGENLNRFTSKKLTKWVCS